jgi:16S rRNA (guanine966-N2)-methyltransferase
MGDGRQLRGVQDGMRIAGGEFCGRILKVPKTDAVRPTQDRVREALFSIMQSEVPGADFLDLFAGSGAVGLEALSRGAKSATFVELDRRHLATLKENLSALCVVAANCVLADVYRWIASYSGPGFSIGFADPPYALGEEHGYASVLKTLAERGVIRAGGLFAAEMTAVQHAEETPRWELLRDRSYGRTRICVWRLAAENTDYQGG